MVLYWQLCKDMHTQILPWIPDTDPKSQLLFLAVANEGKKEKAQPKMWGDSQDWLALLIADLSDPVIIAMAGATHWTTRQYFQFFSSAHCLSKSSAPRSFPLVEHVFSDFLKESLKELYRTYFSEDGVLGWSTWIQANKPTRSIVAVPSDKGLEEGAHEASDPHDMEKLSFLLDCAATAQLMLSHKQQADGALEILNLGTCMRNPCDLTLTILISSSRSYQDLDCKAFCGMTVCKCK